MAKGKTVFISFKNELDGQATQEAKVAEEINARLKKMRINTYMMNARAFGLGSSYFKKEIDDALEDSSCMVVIGSDRSSLESGWVRYEWDTFLNEILAGRKQGDIFTVRLQNFEVSDLPIGLRRYQSFDSKNYEQLYMWINSALSKKSVSKNTRKYQFLYNAVFTKREQGGYDVFFPDLAISTDGKNISEAYMYAKGLLKAYFEYVLKYDIDFAKPKTYEYYAQEYPDKIIMMVDAIIEQKESNKI